MPAVSAAARANARRAFALCLGSETAVSAAAR